MVALLLFLKEEDKSKQAKRIMEMVRLATMHDDSWVMFHDIYQKNPAQAHYVFNELSRLSRDQALELLTDVKEGKITPASLPRRAKAMPPPPADAVMAVHRQRQREKNQQGNG